MPADDLLDALDPEQREVALALRGPVRVLAGAGTGKTRAITHRIAYGVRTGVYDPHSVLALSFTTRAAGEMRSRLRALGAPGVQARTFHSAALRQVRYFWPQVYDGEVPELTASKMGLLAAAARRQRLNADQAALRDLAAEVEWAKVSNVTPESYPTRAEKAGREVSLFDHATVGRIFAGYEEVKRESGRMDMEDVLLIAAAILTEDDKVAAAVRRQYKWLVVDEFQDVSPIQQSLVDLWLGGRDEICVVGDPAQTIYSFAGARADYLRTFPSRYPGATSIELVRNYRSTPEVVTTANRLLHGTPSAGVQLKAQAAPGPVVDFHADLDEVAGADRIARRISALARDGVPLREIAVLYRTNAQSEVFEESLTAAEIPFLLRGAERFFERQEVRQAMALLRQTASRTPDAPVTDAVEDVLASLQWQQTAPQQRGQARERWESLRAVLDLAQTYVADDAQGTVTGLVEDLERRAQEQHAPVVEGVTLSTYHAAKGLEWDAVFLAGVHEGVLPISYATTPAEVEEERRLLYVGITRARRHLAISWALARSHGGQARRKPSRFLDPVLPETLKHGPKKSAPNKRRTTMVCRMCAGPLDTPAARNRGYCENCPVPYDVELLAELKQWRKQRADDESVPAFVIFSDATLEALAEARPTNRPGLLKINGIGQTKLEKYSEDLLGILAG